MTYERALYLMNIERLCIIKSENCGRKCEGCELVQDSGELVEAYSMVIFMLQRRLGEL